MENDMKEIVKDGKAWLEIAPGTFAPKADGPGKNVIELSPGVFVEKAFWGSPIPAELTPGEKAEEAFFDRMTAALAALKKLALENRDVADDLNAIEALNRANPSAWYCFEEIRRLLILHGIES
jgi:hypothetical protein